MCDELAAVLLFETGEKDLVGHRRAELLRVHDHVRVLHAEAIEELFVVVVVVYFK